ncbi:outer membrane protein assembly factor BamB family protein [Haloarchaeobius sp. DT45]|uniref:outer membrane protein assembly factor BamB family protein n=1 Tax=Haloarchaeobius sp. DT45 TaxID=3446116 RepID=UPI003F6D593F
MRPTRRRLLAACGGLAGAAGCLGDGDDDTAAQAESTPDGATVESTTTAESGVDGQLTGSYRQFQYDGANTGRADVPGPTGDVAPRWTFRRAEPGPAYAMATPAVADGTVYLAEGGTAGGEEDDEMRTLVAALDGSTGEPRWTTTVAGTNVVGDVAVSGETVLVQVSGSVVAFDAATGTERWRASNDLDSGMTVADGTVFVAGRGYDGPTTLYALAVEDGRERWTAETGGGEFGPIPSPAVADGLVYAGTSEGLTCLAAGDGTEQWRIDLGGSATAPPSVGSDAVYAAAGNATVHAVGLDGNARWQTTVEGAGSGGPRPILASPALGADSLFVAQTWTLHALSTADGAVAWTRRAGAAGPPVVAGDGLYVRSFDEMAAFSPADGSRLWSFGTNATSGTPRPPAVVDGVALFPSDGLYALE